MLVGYGRVGRLVADGLLAAGVPFLVVEDQEDRVDELKRAGIEAIDANAASPAAIAAANIAGARRLILAIPDGFEASGVLRKARQLNPKLEIVARAHSDAEVEHLRQSGAEFIIMGEREVARGMLAHVLGIDAAEVAAEAEADGVQAYAAPAPPESGSAAGGASGTATAIPSQASAPIPVPDADAPAGAVADAPGMQTAAPPGVGLAETPAAAQKENP